MENDPSASRRALLRQSLGAASLVGISDLLGGASLAEAQTTKSQFASTAQGLCILSALINDVSFDIIEAEMQAWLLIERLDFW